MTAVPLGETPSLCVLCPDDRRRIARSGGVTCWLCHDRIAEQLGEIVQRYARLTAKISHSHDFGRRAPGYHSRPPLNIHAAALRDPRTAPVEVGEPHAPLNLFISWANWIRGQRRQATLASYPTQDDLAILDFEWRYLTNSIDWITRQPWVDRLAEQAKAVVNQLRTATGEPNPRPIGTCDGIEGVTAGCGHPLFPPTEGRGVQCGGCGAVYDPLEQIRMARRRVASCASCGHQSAQHSNDEEGRPCNMQWCECTGFAEEGAA